MTKSESWETRLQRSEELARKAEPTKEILTFYSQLLQSQKEVDEFLRSRRGWLPSGSLAEDLPVVRECFPIVLRTVEANGPAPLADEARGLMSVPGGTDISPRASSASGAGPFASTVRNTMGKHSLTTGRSSARDPEGSQPRRLRRNSSTSF